MSKSNYDYEVDLLDQQRGIGDNNPPSELEIAEQNADAAAADIIKRRDKALAAHIVTWNKRDKIVDQKQADAAAEFIKEVGKFAAEFEKLRKEKKGFYDKIASAVQAKFKGYVRDMDESYVKVRQMLGAYLAEQERKAEQARAAEAALIAAQQKEAEEKGEVAPEIIEQAPVQSAAKLKTSGGTSASTRKVWKWRLKNLADVPILYHTTNDVLLDALCKATKPEDSLDVPGIEFYQESTLRVS